MERGRSDEVVGSSRGLTEETLFDFGIKTRLDQTVEYISGAIDCTPRQCFAPLIGMIPSPLCSVPYGWARSHDTLRPETRNGSPKDHPLHD